jgi:TatD DNase family protein
MAENLIFETHAHYDDEAFSEDRYKLLEGMKSWGIGTVMNIGASIESSRTSLELAEKYPFVYAAVGVHPEYADRMNEEILAELETLAQKKKVVAIGEIGLDYHGDYERDIPLQKKWFTWQLKLARELKLPVVIHSRDAAADTMEILKAQDAGSIGGVMHCYSYSVEIAREVVKMGLYIGIGGVLTFKNGRKLKEVAAETPMERILLETDCPYLAPTPYRGQRNDSRNIALVAEELARIKGITPEEVLRITEENARRFYKL